MDSFNKEQNAQVKYIKSDLNRLGELINISHEGSIVEGLSTRIMELVEMGPMAHVRENYCMRSTVEKDIMKAQNMSRRQHDELKLQKDLANQMQDRLDKLDQTFLTEKKFKVEIKPYAKRDDIKMVLSKIEPKANKLEMKSQFEDIEAAISKVAKNLKEDYPTRSIISNYIAKINQRIDNSTVTPD